jgi:hypothetical protein
MIPVVSLIECIPHYGPMRSTVLTPRFDAKKPPIVDPPEPTSFLATDSYIGIPAFLAMILAIDPEAPSVITH